MTPVERLLERLDKVKPLREGYAALCPAHGDARASLSVKEGDDGRALVYCHAGCATSDVVAALALTMRDLMPDREEAFPARVASAFAPARAAARRRPVETWAKAEDAVRALDARRGPHARVWEYHDAAGTVVGLVLRWDRADGAKDIRPVSRYADGWRMAAMPAPRPLYRLPDLARAARVVVVEGEKCADAARRIGLVATTSAGGASASAHTDWSALAAKEVWILPDADPPGAAYADDVARVLASLHPPARVTRVHLPGLRLGGDLADWIDARPGHAPEALAAEIAALARAAAAEPVVGEPLADATDNVRPFPVDALPEPVRGFVAAGANAIGCDPSYLALPLLVALGAAVGMTRRLELKRGWAAPPILWGAIVGESGTAKTPAFKLVMRPVRERQRRAMERHACEGKRHEAERAQWEKEYAAWKRDRHASGDPPAEPVPLHAERFIVSDTTVEALAPILQANPRGVLMARDELAGWIGSFDRYAGKGGTGADAANWLSMFNAESIIVDRKTGTPRMVHVPRAAVCVVGGIQPGILSRVLGSEHRESGLAARLLLSYPPRRAKRWTKADIDPAAEAAWARLYERLYELTPAAGAGGATEPVTVHLDAPARAAWIAYYNEHAEEQAELTGDLSAAWSKLEEYAARLALVLHFARWAAGDPMLANANVVDAKSMTAGIELAKWFKGEARRVYARLDESDADRDRRRLVEWIGRKGGTATARDVQQGCRWLKEPGAADAALSALVKAGRGSWRPPVTDREGGRPTRVFVLSTPSTVHPSTVPVTPTTDVDDEGSVDVDGVAAPSGPPTESETERVPFGAATPSTCRPVDETPKTSAPTTNIEDIEPFPFGANNPDDPDGERLSYARSALAAPAPTADDSGAGGAFVERFVPFGVDPDAPDGDRLFPRAPPEAPYPPEPPPEAIRFVNDDRPHEWR